MLCFSVVVFFCCCCSDTIQMWSDMMEIAQLQTNKQTNRTDAFIYDLFLLYFCCICVGGRGCAWQNDVIMVYGRMCCGSNGKRKPTTVAIYSKMQFVSQFCKTKSLIFDYALRCMQYTSTNILYRVRNAFTILWNGLLKWNRIE